MTFNQITICGLLNILAIVFVLADGNRTKQTAWTQTQAAQTQIEARSAVERTQIEQQKATAQAYAQNRIAPPTDVFVVQGYALTDQPPIGIDWMHSVDPSRRTIVTDQFRLCIGYAQNGQLFFINDNPTACEAPP